MYDSSQYNFSHASWQKIFFMSISELRLSQFLITCSFHGVSLSYMKNRFKYSQGKAVVFWLFFFRFKVS